jgi:hypothetical protein
MSIRDKDILLDFCIPLFSGITGGHYAGIHAGPGTDGDTDPGPPNPYTPYLIDRETIDCGELVGIDSHITKPNITFPTAGASIYSTDTITSSAFITDTGETHAASRWQFENSDASGTHTGVIAKDTHLDTVHKTSIPVSIIPPTLGNWYYVRVRYKGSVEGEECSPWSDPRLFQVIATPPTPLYRIPGKWGQIACAEFGETVAASLAAWNAAMGGGFDFAPGYPTTDAVRFQRTNTAPALMWREGHESAPYPLGPDNPAYYYGSGELACQNTIPWFNRNNPAREGVYVRTDHVGDARYCVYYLQDVGGANRSGPFSEGLNLHDFTTGGPYVDDSGEISIDHCG